jgi:uncharacterized protein (DUF58 family)
MNSPVNPAGVIPKSSARLSRLAHLEISEVWIKFLLAIVGLILAFAAAMFSTVSRESGNIWATVILASAALLLATIVGLTTVPYLARRVVVVRIRDAFHYDVTRAGMVYVVITVVIGIAALNTGNNLLYIIVAAMLAAILVSGFASAVVLRDLELDVRLPEHVFAGRPVLGRILVRNPRRKIPSFSIRVVPSKVRKQKGWTWEPYTFALPLNRPPEQQWLRLPDRRLRRMPKTDPLARIFEGSAYFPFIPAQREVAAELEMRFDRRGLYHEDSFGLATRFPFAFLTKTRTVPMARELVVYPRVEETDELLEVLPLITGEFESFVRGRGYDLYRIREYMPEDSARYLDWKATAKSGSLKLREFSREDERKLRIVFDNPAPGVVSGAAYERAVALAASLAWHFASTDTEISFVAQGFRGTELYQFLRYLALAAPQSSDSVIHSLNITDDFNLILTSRAHGTIPTALWSCSYFLFIEEGRIGTGRGNIGVQQKPLGSHPMEKRP